jgi:hypothetical protein
MKYIQIGAPTQFRRLVNVWKNDLLGTFFLTLLISNIQYCMVKEFSLNLHRNGNIWPGRADLR